MNLSILIPARNEEFLARTIADVLDHLRGDTEIIAVLDGAWADPPIPDHPRVMLVRQGAAIGQRAATNQAARLARGRYVMKLDAHCSVAEGFDVELVRAGDELGPDVTQIPRMLNLHAFDWVCAACQVRTYQGPKPQACRCGGVSFDRDLVWRAKPSPVTDFARFDTDLHFQYWRGHRDETGRASRGYGHRPEAQGDIADALTSIGACFVMRRDRFFELGGLDEAHGIWGQFGVEIALKSWLSGGRHVVNKRTHFAHLFRTQPGFRFPYPLSHAQTEQARTYSKQLWLNDAWPKAVRPLSWLLRKFAPIPGWTEDAIAALERRASPPAPRATKGLCYYTHNRGDARLLQRVRDQLRQSANGYPIVSVQTGTPRLADGFGTTGITLDLAPGVLTMFKQILAGLEALDTDYAFLVEHDLLYHPSHFDFTPPRRDAYYYNVNVWKVDAATGRAVTYVTKQTSGLCADRRLLIEHYRTRVARVERDGFSRRMGFEPGSHRRPERVDDIPSEVWRSPVPNIDLRHGANLTPSRWRPEEFRNQRNCQGWTEGDGVPGWGRTLGRFDDFLEELSRV